MKELMPTLTHGMLWYLVIKGYQYDVTVITYLFFIYALAHLLFFSTLLASIVFLGESADKKLLIGLDIPNIHTVYYYTLYASNLGMAVFVMMSAPFTGMMYFFAIIFQIKMSAIVNRVVSN